MPIHPHRFATPHLLVGLLLLLCVSLIGCDDGVTDIDPGQLEPTTTYQVEYRAESSFASCDLNYRAADDVVVELEDVALPWVEQVFVEVPVDESFTARVAAACGGPDFVGTGTVRVIVDGFEQDREVATGTEFTIEAETVLGDAE